ncbi:MAG: FeoA family protein [Desulfovibrionaceae bacterium]
MLTIDKAPSETPLAIIGIKDPVLAERLGRLGVHVGDRVSRLAEEAMAGPVRVRGPKGEVVLAAGMAAKIIAHHDDRHKTPVLEMNPGEEGHVEGLVCGSAMEKGLEVLGIRENDRITMVRRIPPMSYQAVVDGRRVNLSEGAAAKIWVSMEGRDMQLAMAGTGKPLTVKLLIGGERALAMLESLGLAPGRTVTVERVAPARVAGVGGRDQIVLAAPSGLRFYLRPDQARAVLVQPAASSKRVDEPA